MVEQRFVRAVDLEPHMVIEIAPNQGLVMQSGYLTPFEDWLYCYCPLIQLVKGERDVNINSFAGRPSACAKIEVHTVTVVVNPTPNGIDLVRVCHSAEGSDRHSLWFLPDDNLWLVDRFNPNTTRRTKANRRRTTSWRGVRR